MHYYPFNIADFNLHTSHLTLEEDAVYRRLIDFYYDTESPIPTETQPVIRRLRLGSYVNEFNQVLNEFFTLEDDGWHSYRCDIEIKAYHDRGDKARANGKKGGRPRKNKGQETQSVNLANPDITQKKANQELITNNQEPVTNKTLDHSANDHDAMIEKLFDKFWVSGIRKVNKKKTKALFSNLLKKLTDCGESEFTQILIEDVKARLNSNQLGFAEMHPTTYLNGERWNDEVINNEQNQSGRPTVPNRQTPAQRTRAAAERWEAEQEGNVQAMGSDAGSLRPPVEQPVRGGTDRDLGATIDGDFTRAD